MSPLIEKTKIATAFTLTALVAASVFGCKEAAPETETIALPEAKEAAADLFDNPMQPNPLAPKATDVILTVEGKNITHGDLMQAVQMRMQQLSQQVQPQQLQQMYPQVYQEMTEMMIANILLNNAAKKSSLAISEEDLAAEIARVEASANSDKPLKETLAENNVDFDEWKANLSDQMLVGKLVEEKTADVAPATEEDAATFYKENIEQFKAPETVTASHILFGFEEGDTDETKAAKKADIEAVRAEILAGASFEELAAAKSSCPSKAQGGSLGTFQHGQMVPEFDAAAFAMSAGDISEIVETQFGYHIIKVTDKTAAGTQKLAEVQDQLIKYLSDRKKQETLIEYIKELQSKADIVRHAPDLDAAADAPAAE